MTTSNNIYNDRAAEYIKQYETLRFEDVHKAIIDYVPKNPGLVLDVGAGSGRDATWFAAQGLDVVAVEPADELRNYAKGKHLEPNIKWIDDSLPDLKATHQLGLTYDFILLSAVWMHVPETQRNHAFRQLITLLKPGGHIVISLRLGPVDQTRHMYPVSVNEIQSLAKDFGLDIVKEVHTEDLLGRKEISWAVVVLRSTDCASVSKG